MSGVIQGTPEQWQSAVQQWQTGQYAVGIGAKVTAAAVLAAALAPAAVDVAATGLDTLMNSVQVPTLVATIRAGWSALATFAPESAKLEALGLTPEYAAAMSETLVPMELQAESVLARWLQISTAALTAAAEQGQ